MRSLAASLTVFVLLLLAGTSISVLGQSNRFVKIVDDETIIPLVPPLTQFGTPSVSEGVVVFKASGEDGYRGIFHNNPRSFTKIVDVDVGVPGAGEKFDFIGEPDISGNWVTFFGGGTGDSVDGVFYGLGGPAPATVAASGDPMPGEGSSFVNFSHFPSVDFDTRTGNGYVVLDRSGRRRLGGDRR